MKILLGMLIMAATMLTAWPSAHGDAAEKYLTRGTWKSQKGESAGTWTATLYRESTGDRLSGTISIDGASVISGATVIGSLTEAGITLGVLHGGVSMAEFDGSRHGDKLTGTYSFSALDDAGTWEGTLALDAK